MKTVRALRMVAIVTVAAGVSGGLMASTASAYNTASYWNQSGSPLVKTGYGSTAQAYGYVKIANGANGTKINNYGWNKFVDADNHRAYLSASSEWNAGSCASYSVEVSYKGVAVAASSSCANAFYDGADFPRADGLNYTSGAWTAFPTTQAGPNGGSDRGRANVHLCIDIPVRVDPCTDSSLSASDSF